MTDTDDVVGFLTAEERRAQGRVFGALEEDPEKGARSIQLAQATGLPPAVVHGDLERVDRETKAGYSNQLISTNAFLRGYINSHDLAATVSNDDYGQLDAASQSITKLGNKSIMKSVIEGFNSGAEYVHKKAAFLDILPPQALAEGWKEGVGPGGVGAWLYKNEKDAAFAQRYPYSAMAYALLGAPIEVPMRLLSGVITAASFGAGQWYTNVTGDPEGKKYGHQFSQFIQDPGVLASIGIPLPRSFSANDAAAHNRMLRNAVDSVDLYVREGKEPPAGMSPMLDAIKLEQAEMDLGNLADALKESVASKTRERAPELYAEFVRQHGDGKIAISAEGIAKLYGDKIPLAEDGILGWVPDIARQYRDAIETGLDVEIPVSEFLAKADPKVFKEIEDHVRVRAEGVTREEGKLATEQAKEAQMLPEGDMLEPEPVRPIDVVRHNAALEPVLAEPIVEGQPRPTRQRAAKQLAFDFSTLDERAAFEQGKAIGMTADGFRLYMSAIEKKRISDLDLSTRKAIADAKLRQTEEWRANEAVVRREVVDSLNARPDINADRFFRESKLYGEDLPEKPKLSTEFLTEEQQALLPKSFQAKLGMHPDDAAGLLGYESGQTLIADLSRLHQDRLSTGGRPDEFFRKLVQAGTEIEMEKRYGSLSKNILREAQDHALSSTQLDILHEETFALAAQAGLEFSIKKGELARAIADRFGETKAANVSVDKLLAAAGKAGRAAEQALLKGDPTTAFKAKQQQYFAIAIAKEAKEFVKEVEQFEKTTDRFSKREVKGVDQEFTDYIQVLLLEAGVEGKRSAQEIASAGRGPLNDFVASQSANGWDVAVSDRVATGGMPAIADMTVAEFREFKDAIDSLAHIGRAKNKITLGERMLEFADFKAEVLENIRSLPAIPAAKQNRLRTRLDAELTKMEEIMRDLDLRAELGPLSNAVIRPMQEAKAREYGMQEALQKKLAGIQGEFGRDWVKTLDDTVPQDFLHDPYTNAPFDLSRQHMINIMMNFGNRSNIDKFVKGYIDRSLKGDDAKAAAATLENQLRDMFDQHATRKDWEYVQHIWDIFEGWKKDSDAMYRQLSGVAPKWIDVQPIDTAHGQFRGGYFPVIYDRLRSNLNVLEERPGGKDLFGANYFRATTSNKYTVERTGYTDFVQFDNPIEQVGARMQQMMHDIAFRPSVMEVGKVLYDREIRSAIRKHYGAEYEAQLDPWLKDIANSFNFDEQKVGAANAIMRRARLNLIAHTLPLNLKVIFSPSTGMTNPRVLIDALAHPTEYATLAHAKSLEIPNTLRTLDRDFRESLESTIAARGWQGVRADAVRWFWGPMVKIEQGFRIATFVDAYKNGLTRGLSEADAVAVADAKIRQQHGAAGTPDLPAIMRSNEAMKIATTFYGWFNTMYNWQRRIPGDLRSGDIKAAWSDVWGAVLVPAAFGMMFVKTNKDDTWFSMMAKSLALQPLSTLPFVRDAGTMFAEGFKPGTPVGSILQAAYSAYTDVKRAVQGKKVEKPITHAANVVGLTAGVPMAQVGRTAQFGSDVMEGKQRPRNILEWIRGITQGEARPKR